MSKTGRADNLEVLVGTLQRDRHRWRDYVKLDGMYVRYWIWDALARMPAGKKVRIKIEVVP